MESRWEIMLEKAQAYFELKEYEKAVQSLAKVFAEHPDHVPSLRLKAQCHLALGQDQEAVELLETVLRHDPGDLVACQTAGQILLQSGQTDRAPDQREGEVDEGGEDQRHGECLHP